MCHPSVATVIKPLVIRIAHPCVYTPYTPLLYSKTGVYRCIHYFLIFALKHKLWVLVRTASSGSNVYPQYIFLSQIMKIVKKKSIENCHFYRLENSLCTAWACFRYVRSQSLCYKVFFFFFFFAFSLHITMQCCKRQY